MSNVVISNRNIFNQRVVNIEQNKVLLPFNVSKVQSEKLIELLKKIKVTFFSELDKLSITSLSYNDINVKTNNKQFNNSRFTLSKTYVVTMKQSFITKVESFYGKVEEIKVPERPVFSIGNETNLQQALAEATTEIDLSTINASLNNNQNLQNTVLEQPQPSQVLANNPLGETIIVNPVNLSDDNQMVNPVPSTEINHTANNNINAVNNINPMQQMQVNPENVIAQQNVQLQPGQSVAPVTQMNTVPAAEIPEQPVKKKRKFFSKKGNILAIPIIAIWLGLVFFGTLKLVTGILT